MAFAQAQTRPHSIAEMNITPLVDVMLVLLVIFMIAAPILSRPIPMDLPYGHPNPPTAQPLGLRISASGELFLADRPIPASALGSILSAERERAGNEPFVLSIQISGDVDYQAVARVLATAKNADVKHIRIQ